MTSSTKRKISRRRKAARKTTMPMQIKPAIEKFSKLSISSFSGNWFMAESGVKKVLSRVVSMPDGPTPPMSAQDAPAESSDSPEGYATVGGMAVIQVVGVLTKYPMPEDWMDDYCGFCPALPIIASLERALADWTIKAIAFVIDSPGGTVAGTSLLAEAIAKANKIKPCYAVVSDQAASAAYYVASQCRSIQCNAMGEVGCIGIYCVLADDSKFWAELGVTFTVVSSGGVKGLGADGVVSQELIDDQKRGVMAMYEKFITDVAAGRGMDIEQVRKLGDGRMWIAPEAKQLGLIDEVASVDAAMQAISIEVTQMQPEMFRQHAAENPDAAEVKEVFAKGHKAGVAQGAADAKSQYAALLTSAKGNHKLAGESFAKGQEPETVASIVAALEQAEVNAKAEADKQAAAMVEKDKEIARLKFEADERKPVGVRPAEEPKAATDIAKIEDPKARAEAEWDSDEKVRVGFSSKASYANFRAAELSGRIKVA